MKFLLNGQHVANINPNDGEINIALGSNQQPSSAIHAAKVIHKNTKVQELYAELDVINKLFCDTHEKMVVLKDHFNTTPYIAQHSAIKIIAKGLDDIHKDFLYLIRQQINEASKP